MLHSADPPYSMTLTADSQSREREASLSVDKVLEEVIAVYRAGIQSLLTGICY